MKLASASLRAVSGALRSGELTAHDLVEACLAAHEERGSELNAYKLFTPDHARSMADRAQAMLDAGRGGVLCGIPVSVKDLYGVEGLPTFAGTPRQLPSVWSEEGWLVQRLREQGSVFVGKTHTVEFAYSGVGINPHWGTPRNPWDPEVHRIPGGSSSGAGVSLMEGSALVALGSDTGGSIRIPASMTGTVGPRFTHGRWRTDGVVPLSSSMDTVGALTRSVEDAAWFFGAIDPAWGDPEELLVHLLERSGPLSLGMPSGDLWTGVDAGVAEVLHGTLDELGAAGWGRKAIEGAVLDDAQALYMGGPIVSAECRDFLEAQLPDRLEILDSTVASRIRGAPTTASEEYRASLSTRNRLMGRVDELFDGVDVLALPGALMTPPPVEELEELPDYLRINALSLQPTCPVSLLGLCAITLPVGLDEAGMPVGLQLVARGGDDERLLAAALAVERELGGALERLGEVPQ